METSRHGSELVAARTAVDLVMSLRHQLRMMGVPIDGSPMMYGDNMSVALKTMVPSSVLKKKMHACAHHRVREAVAAGIVKFKHIKSKLNLADVLTKPLAYQDSYNLIKPHLFRVPMWDTNH